MTQAEFNAWIRARFNLWTKADVDAEVRKEREACAKVVEKALAQSEQECPNLKNCNGACFQCEYFNVETGEMEYPVAQPEQEPVKIVQYNCTCGRTMKFESEHGVIAPQRTWVGLTDEDTFEIGERLGLADVAWIDLMKAIEAKLKERNT